MNSSQLENLERLIHLFTTESTYEKELMSALPLPVKELNTGEMEYHRKFEHNIGRIQHIDLMSRLGIC